MSEYYFLNALGYTFEQLTEMHNKSFSGYFVPITMTPEQTADFWRNHQIDATRCVVMHDEKGSFVGMARMGTRGKRGWCGGFGIVPEFRGTQASRQLAAEMVRVARDSGLKSLQLEVLSQNARAIKLYERIGFSVQRRLFGLELSTADLAVDHLIPAERVVIDVPCSWPLKATHRPCWGLELASLMTTQSEAFVLAGPDGQLNAFSVQYVQHTARIQSVWLQSQLTDDEFATLLHSVAGDATTIQIYNEPEESEFLSRYTSLGFSEFFNQYEMLLEL